MKKRTFSKLTSFLLMAVSFAFFTALIIGCETKAKKDEVIIYLVRHAEKDLADTTGNPNLTPAGEQRAQNLKHLLEGIVFDGIYSTDFIRTQKTVEPLAHGLGLEVLPYTTATWEEMLDAMHVFNGKTYLICGHSNNLMPMIYHLGGVPPMTELEHSEYDKLFKVTLSEGSVDVEMSTY